MAETRTRAPAQVRAQTHRDRGLRRTLLAGALALGLVTGGGVAWAYWTESSTATGTDVPSGRLDLTAGPTTGSEQLAGTGGSWTWTGLQLPAAFPGESRAQAVVLRSSGTTSVSVQASIRSATAAMSPYLLATTVIGGAAGNTTAANGFRTGTCTGGTAAASGVAVSTTPTAVVPATRLAAGATMTVCVVLSLSATAPNTLQGTQAATVSIALSAAQVRP